MVKRQKKFDIVSIGGVTRDIMFYSGEGELIATGDLTKQKLLAFEYGAKITADKLYYTFGGGAANTAAAFAKLGLKTAAIARVGNNEDGRQVIANLRAKRVATDFISIDRDRPTSFSLILTVRGTASEHIIFAYRGANDTLMAAHLPLGRLTADWFYVSSLPRVGWEKIMAAVTRPKSSIAWNPGSRQLAEMPKVKKFLPRVKLLILNRDEALEFKKLKDTKGLLKYIQGLGPELVVITDGVNGVYAFDGKKYYFMKARKRPAVDTVGIGDAFAAAFTAALIYRHDIKTALSWGIANSASVVGQIGAQNGLLSKKQIG